MRLSRRKRAALGALIAWGLSMAAHPPDVRGAEWAMEPTVSAKGEYNDNILLTTAAHDAVWGTWFSPGTTFKLRTEILEVEGSALADFVRYYGQSGLDITNLFFPATARYKTERDLFQLDGAFTRDNTLVGELQQTGVVNRRTQRNLQTAHPSWKHGLTDRLSLNAEYQYTDVSYDDAARFSLFDYRTHLGSSGLSYQVSDRDQVDVTGYYLAYRAPALNLDSDYFGFQLGASHAFSESFRATVAGGFRNVTSTTTAQGLTQRSTDFVWVFNGSVEKKLERSFLTAGFAREINPSGVGFLVQTDHLSASATHEITKRLSASLTGDAYWITPTLTSATIPNSRYLRIEPKLHYRWSEWWSVDLIYHHARLEVDVVNTTASQNAAYLSVTYNIPKLALSW